MKVLLQRVSQASVEVDGQCAGAIGVGLLLLLGLDKGDDEATADRMLDKLLAYRVFPDEAGRMNRSVVDVSGGVLLVSQFTLSADTRKGLRPSFSTALPPAEAETLYHYTLAELQRLTCRSRWSTTDRSLSCWKPDQQRLPSRRYSISTWGMPSSLYSSPSTVKPRSM